MQDENQCWKPQTPLLPLPLTLDSQVKLIQPEPCYFLFIFQNNNLTLDGGAEPEKVLAGKIVEWRKHVEWMRGSKGSRSLRPNFQINNQSESIRYFTTIPGASIVSKFPTPRNE